MTTMPPVLDLNLQEKQAIAFESVATEILYGGAAGGGKSHLMRVMAIFFACEIPGLQIYIFRRNYADLYKNHMDGPSGFPAMLHSFVENGLIKITSDNEIKFWNGSKINLCHLQYKKNLQTYQGAEIHMLLMDELTHFTAEEYRYLRGRCRIVGLKVPAEYKHLFPRILCGTNPGGLGHNWVKADFVDSATPLSINKMVKSEGGMLRQFIPALLEDNPALLAADPEYGERLEGLGNPALVKAMRTGDWNIVVGGALDDVWTQKAIKPRFKVPSQWRLFRSFDWGSTHPFSYGLWAEANGEEVEMPDGSKFCPRPGSLIRVHEWYGTKKIGSNVGLKMASREVARGIIEAEQSLYEHGWLGTMPERGIADGQIFNQIEADVPAIATKMGDEGVFFEPADKSAGSRMNGLQLVRDRLEAVQKDREEPGIYFMEHCIAAIGTLPVLPRDDKKPDDVNTKAEDHVYDDVRYAVLHAQSGYTADYSVEY